MVNGWRCREIRAGGWVELVSVVGMAWSEAASREDPVKDPKHFSDELDYSVGYDYNGIPQDENEDPNPVHQTQMLECEQAVEKAPSPCPSFRAHYI